MVPWWLLQLPLLPMNKNVKFDKITVDTPKEITERNKERTKERKKREKVLSSEVFLLYNTFRTRVQSSCRFFFFVSLFASLFLSFSFFLFLMFLWVFFFLFFSFLFFSFLLFCFVLFLFLLCFITFFLIVVVMYFLS